MRRSPLIALLLIVGALQAGTNAFAEPILFRYRVIADVVALRAVADADGDGRGDILLASGGEAGGSGFPGVLRWHRYPDFRAFPINDPPESSYIADLEAADLDGDGDPDLIAPIAQEPGDTHRRVIWWENPRPDRPATDRWPIHQIGEIDRSDGPGKDLAVLDADGDGRLDVAVRTHNAVFIWYQDAPDRWTERFVGDLPWREGMDAGDIDGDGDPDVVLNGYWLENPGTRDGAWQRRTIDARWFAQDTGTWRDNSCRVLVADLNGDGLADPVFGQSEQPGFPVVWYRAIDPHADRWEAHEIGQIDYCHSLQAGDLDLDGDTDVVAAEMPRYDAPYPVVIFQNEGEGLRWNRQAVSTDTGSYILVVGDVGGDGDLDLVGGRSFKPSSGRTMGKPYPKRAGTSVGPLEISPVLHV
ncbi:MAG: hypothetical protein KatS3mg115_2291 [Candidatus Poribacteria bacterium]|nr:MAG: hypothetical protein KatS3mg115_2291 [Candidatus Poribacteria bacterium]